MTTQIVMELWEILQNLIFCVVVVRSYSPTCHIRSCLNCSILRDKKLGGGLGVRLDTSFIPRLIHLAPLYSFFLKSWRLESGDEVS